MESGCQTGAVLRASLCFGVMMLLQLRFGLHSAIDDANQAGHFEAC